MSSTSVVNEAVGVAGWLALTPMSEEIPLAPEYPDVVPEGGGQQGAGATTGTANPGGVHVQPVHFADDVGLPLAQVGGGGSPQESAASSADTNVNAAGGVVDNSVRERVTRMERRMDANAMMVGELREEFIGLREEFSGLREEFSGLREVVERLEKSHTDEKAASEQRFNQLRELHEQRFEELRGMIGVLSGEIKDLREQR